MKRQRKRMGFFLVCLICLASTSVNAKEISKKVKVGHTISVEQEGAVYKSSNTKVAYVNEEGRVTGKKAGNAVITVKKGGKKKKINVKVKIDGNKPSLKVAADEVEVTGGPASIQVTNKGKMPSKKIVVIARVNSVETEFSTEALAPGASVILDADSSTMETPIMLIEKKVYTGDMIATYNYINNTTSYEYGAEDTTPPVISGFVGEKSYNRNEIYQVVYTDQKNTYNYFKYVSAQDERDQEVKLTVDTSNVDFSKEGVYTLVYQAEDAAGNIRRENSCIEVRIPGQAEQMADQILSSIIKESWSDTKKAKAIYKYVKGHVRYTGHSDKSSWRAEAARGIRNGQGDCFTYYAVSRVLFGRMNIPSLTLKRYQCSTRHWWNFVYIQGAFYHFDCTPRQAGGDFCLITDSQIKVYSNANDNSHKWNYSAFPKSGTKKLSKI